ncbi:unnamed protein product [Adineta steineri]|uniref:THO1-MOS11 C-terminal domain-containing protein n=1 Tax=Adineta steineri TaxID=433720 RepID=A0A815NLP0_9BILA|nr:unnamed protein product [Adineta steineri]CAF4183492.1 unnamed protein product [Adineta steineri]
MTTDTKISNENTQALAETLTEFELNTGVISADNQNEETSATDKIKQRLERFGKVAPEAKKISRALRFGTTHEAITGTAKKRRLERFGVLPHSTEEVQQKKRQRAERFHVNNSGSTEDGDVKKKRLDRFGSTTSSSSSTTTPLLSDAVQKRTQRFGDVSKAAKLNTMNEQKNKRAERFKLNTNV